MTGADVFGLTVALVLVGSLFIGLYLHGRLSVDQILRLEATKFGMVNLSESDHLNPTLVEARVQLHYDFLTGKI
jgi:hypothetical protein